MAENQEANPIISVILPFYNAESTLQRAIDSIYKQTFQNFECILINNNSSDGSVAIANKWCEADSRFKLINEEIQGVMFASNAGLKIAKGNFIARMDADDFSFPERLALQYQFLSNNLQYGAVSGMVEYVSHNNKTEGFERYVDWVNSVVTYRDIFIKRFIESPIVNPTAMWRKSIAIEFGMYETGDFPEDYEMWLRWLHNGVKIAKINEPVLKWYDSYKRLTRTDEIYSDNAFFEIKTKYLAKELKRINPFYPKVAVWGASKISINHASYLIQNNLEVEFYIDIKRNKQKIYDVVYYEDIPLNGSCFILVYIKHHELRQKTQQLLESKGYVEGKDYLLLS